MISDFINQTPRELAEWLHERYEIHAKNKGWETQKVCQVPFDDLPKANKETMLAVAMDMRLRDMEFLEAIIDDIKRRLVDDELADDLSRRQFERISGTILRIVRIALL